jgi:hypothetical protein
MKDTSNAASSRTEASVDSRYETRPSTVEVRTIGDEFFGRYLSRRSIAGKIGFGCVVIGDEEIPFEEFFATLQSYVDWHFSIEIHDGYDEF